MTDTATLTDQSWAALLFGNDLLDPGEALTVDLFENSASDTPFLSQSFAGDGTHALLTDSSSAWTPKLLICALKDQRTKSSLADRPDG